MKNVNRSVKISLSRLSGAVLNGRCTSPAGASDYCNHVMALPLLPELVTIATM